MCFSKEGFLFREFNDIFRDILGRKSQVYKQIVKFLSDGSAELGEIAKELDVKVTGGLSDTLSILVESNFISRDYTWSLSGKKRNLSKYRLSDNYLRFYLKYIEPIKENIENGLFTDARLENMKAWETIMGFQIENLVLNNLSSIIEKLDISPESIISAAPYFQKKTARSELCQVDLLIDTRYSVYICEIKYRAKIDAGVINSMEQKIQRLKIHKNKSIRPILIYLGDLSLDVEKSDVFVQTLPLDSLLSE